MGSNLLFPEPKRSVFLRDTVLCVIYRASKSHEGCSNAMLCQHIFVEASNRCCRCDLIDIELLNVVVTMSWPSGHWSPYNRPFTSLHDQSCGISTIVADATSRSLCLCKRRRLSRKLRKHVLYSLIMFEPSRLLHHRCIQFISEQQPCPQLVRSLASIFQSITYRQILGVELNVISQLELRCRSIEVLARSWSLDAVTFWGSR